MARYLCRENQKRKHSHRTFSLLPDSLIPYYSITIDTLIIILQLLLTNNVSLHEALNSIDSVSPEDILFSEMSLRRFCILFKQTRMKLILFFQGLGRKHRAPPGIASFTSAEILQFMLDYIPPENAGMHSSSRHLSCLYYIRNGSYMKNANFLFGTASQFHKRS